MNNKILMSILAVLIIIIVIVGLFIAFNPSEDDNNSTKINNTTAIALESNNVSQSSSESQSSSNSIEDNRPVNDPNYKGYNPYHESEITADGWNPNEHEVSREYIGDGLHRIEYDDGYFRICDENGYVVNYGY
ncbi:hypothetical protein [Methanobrevibacter woesei]|uniref:hypothetical protein n=1 Tax=Methanobrevibacter woesei TaxID=190976 RepID=UPI0023EFE14A|nr:hypothetical protein [Methanobrevibacter woesei]